MPRLEYDVVFTINTSSVSTLKDELNDISGSGLQSANKSAKDLNKTFSRTAESAEDIGDSISLSSEDMERFQQNTADASVAMQRMDDASRQAATGTQNMSKSVNNSNQILFSFGDAMQDGAQFQQSFGAGARAVGNNLTFAAEQIALANQKTGSIAGTFKSLGSALLGPAGVVFAVNAAVTAITVWSNTASSAEEEAKKFQDALDNLNNSFSRTVELQEQFGAFDEDEFGILQAQATIREITEDLSVQRDRLNRVNDLEEERQDLLLQQSQTSDLSEQQQSRLEALNNELTRLGSSEDIQENIKELEQERLQLSTELINTGEALADSDTIRARQNSQVTAEFKSQLETLRFMQGLMDTTQFLPERDAPLVPRASVEGAEKGIEVERERLSKFLGIRKERARAIFGIERNLENSLVNLREDSERTKTNITRQQTAARKQLISQAASAAGNILTAAFGQSKEVRIAQTLIDTYASAQSAYASQLIPGDPSSLGRAQVAAGLAVASGLARVAQIVQTDIGDRGGSGGGGNASFSQGISTTDVNRPQQPNASVGRDAAQQSPDIIIEANNILPDTEFSKRADRGRKHRETDSITVRRNR